MTTQEIRQLIEKDAFLLYAQPKWSIGKNTCNTYDVFAEKVCLENGELQDARPLLEDISKDKTLTFLFSNWFLHKALKTAKDISDKTDVNITLSMKALPVYCNRSEFRDELQKALLDTGFRADKLQLEISESQALTQEGIDGLNHLHDVCGVSLWLSNFGVGNSNVDVLTKLNVDGIETHRLFTAQAEHDEKVSKLLVAIQHFADTLDLMTCGKGVETEEQMQFFEDYGYDKVQGFFISTPMDMDEVEEYVKTYGVKREE